MIDISQYFGETPEYDKKAMLETKRPKSWCKTVSAFANSFGGKLIFGIADDDSVPGLEDAKKAAEEISEIVKMHLNPIPEFNLSFHTINDKQIIIVDVKAGNQTPYYYQGEGQLCAFVRIGNESVQASPSQLRDLVIKGSGQSYDSLRSQFQFGDMAFTKLRSVYYKQTGHSFEQTDYESFGIIDANGNLTNAGALVADESPVRQSRVFCTRWNGITKAAGLIDAFDDAEFSGSIITLLQEGLAFIARNNKKAWKKLPYERVELSDYPERACMEALVNALIHRNYLEIGSEVHIDIFDDRLEIYSPGGMLDGTTLEGRDLLSIPSKRRNPVLADIFSRLNFMERRGSGFKKILESYSESQRKPVFKTDFGDFLIVLPNVNYGNAECDTINDTINDTIKLNENESEVLELIKQNVSITREILASSTGLSESTVSRILKKLQQSGILIRDGSKKNGKWIIEE